VFSPYYARARARDRGDPAAHCAVNLALYRLYSNSWVMSEYGRGASRRTAQQFEIGPNALEWRGEELAVRIDERTAPWRTRIRGVLIVRPRALVREAWSLDTRGVHRWQPIAPCSRVTVEFDKPAMRWSGNAYFDSNFGAAPLEDAFSGWTWSRFIAGRDTIVQYDLEPRGAPARALALRFSPEDAPRELEPLAARPLPRTGWGLARSSPVDLGEMPCLERTLEDTPFYARSLVAEKRYGERGTSVHESLSLDRFRSAWVNALLPFRMRRR
jgi:carotenoid 1,2-hydratase